MKKLNLCTFLCLYFFTLNLYAQRIGSSDQKWKTIKTPHFDVIFSAEQQDLGPYYAQVAERAYQNLITVFTSRPDRIVIVVNDSTDLSNGYATRIPYPLIMAYPVQVGDHDSLTEAGEWARELITHEMTHILQFEPAHGFYDYIRPIFGTIVAPNLLLPLWWKEGMAVEMETQFSPGGRLRSHFQDATLRAFHLEHKLFSYTLAEANEILPSWPYGSRAYVFGSIFWSQVVKDHKKSAADFIAQRHGERVPYFVEQPMYDLADSTYEMKYQKALTEVDENARAQVEKIEKVPTTKFNFLANEGQSSSHPSFSKSQGLVAYIDNVDGENRVQIQTLDGTLLKELKRRPKESIIDIDFHPTERKLVYAKTDDVSVNLLLSDLYIYDIEKGKSEKLPGTDRARSPRFSDDGSKIVFVTTANGRSQLKIIDVATKKVDLIKEFTYQERVYSPLFWDADHLLYTKRLADTKQNLIRYDLKNKTETQLLTTVNDIHFLKKSGQKLFFTSTQNGVPNVYVTTDFKKMTAVTNALTGVWSFDVDPISNRLWASVMTGDGFKVAEAKLETISTPLPVIENKIANRYQFADSSKEVTIPDPEDYEAAGYLWPRYWIPYLATASSSKGAYIQAQTSGQDPLQIHRYSLAVNYQTDINKGGFNGSYTNSAFALPFQVGALQTNQSFGNIDQIVETKTMYASILPDLFHFNKYTSLQLGVQTFETNYLGTNAKNWGGFTQVGYLNYSQNIFQISPEKGAGALIRYENNKNVENSKDFNRVLGTLIGFYSYGLPKHHAIMSRLNGTLTFESVSSRFGTSNTSAFLVQDYLLPEFVIRGYPINQFYGRSLWTWNTEYRFPVADLNKGSGTDPFFFKQISGTVVADGLGVQGVGITENKVGLVRNLNESLWSAGVELKLTSTIGYVIPMNFVLGYYFPFSTEYSKSSQAALSLQIGGL
ncbi:MAG: PD40 domain-containing protein [Bdellovibrionaceae bacterium]|nr:PD40 domain-containing protein [Pseudobdellovibrionaceae bacterium]MBC7456993.1 PD40 domain-containing protein [Pseudobdellovibrionaceae bacterium]